MGWYDVFAISYDLQLEGLYRPHREALAKELSGLAGKMVLDLACGTGQSFPFIIEAVGEQGCLLGIDRSKGMLAKARRRVARAGWKNVSLLQLDARDLGSDVLEEACGGRRVDAVLASLALSAIDDWRSVFEASFALLEGGGRYLILDVHAEERGFSTKLVEWIARADLSRQVWQPLAERASSFEKVDLPADPKTFGGTLFMAVGVR